MKKRYMVPGIVFGVGVLFLVILEWRLQFCMHEFYAKNMRMPLFTGFLTVGGFLLSLKTFILIKLKEDLYELPSYKERFERRRYLNPTQKLSLYGPLVMLGNFLYYCVLGALITSVFQFTLGFIDNSVATAICISVAAATLSILFLAWWQIHKNLTIWFDLLEQEYEKSRQDIETLDGSDYGKQSEQL